MKIHHTPLVIKKRYSILESVNAVYCFRCLLVIVLTGFLFLFPTYSQENVGVIHGKLIDGTVGKPITDHLVILNVHKAGNDISQQETTTDADGHYHFEKLSIDMQTHYSITTTYNDTEHIEKDLMLSTFVPELVVDINIAGFTDDISKISFKTYSITMGFESELHLRTGLLSIFEVFAVENKSTLPFQTTLNDQEVGLYFALPEGYALFKPFSPASLSMNPTKSHAILTTPLRQGKSEGGFGYNILANGRNIELARRMSIHTDEIILLIPQSINIAPRSEEFKQENTTQFHGVVYTRYVAAPEGGFTVGETPDLSLTVSGLPFARQESKIGQMVLIAVAAALAGGFLVAAIFTLRASKQTSTVSDTSQAQPMETGWLRKLSDTDLDDARTTRLEFVATLDTLHEKKEISERVYNRLRKEQTEILTEILDQRKERGIDS